MENTAKESQVGKSKSLVCRVVSTSSAMTRVAIQDRLVKNQEYGKYTKRQTRLMFHDQNSEAKLGDLVEIAACSPKSASKRFKLVKVLKSVSVN